MISAAMIGFLCLTNSFAQQTVPSTTFKVGKEAPPVVAEFVSGPWKGQKKDIVKHIGKDPVVIFMSNPMATDLDTLVSIADHLEKIRASHEAKRLQTGIVSYYMGRPDGEGSKAWLQGQLTTLEQLASNPNLNLGLASVTGDLRKAYQLRDGFGNATYVIKDGVVRGVCDAIGGTEADLNRLSKCVESALVRLTQENSK